jgi:hypothetical protein
VSRVADLLGIYLNDHLAGATAGVQLARRLRGSNAGHPDFGAPLSSLCDEVEADREALEEAMALLGVGRDKLKPLFAFAGERLGRLKLNGQLRGYSPLSRLIELEVLQLGIAGKRRMWRALEQTHGADLSTVDPGSLAERASRQLRKVEALHLKAAALAL